MTLTPKTQITLVDNGGSYEDHEIYLVTSPVETVQKVLDLMAHAPTDAYLPSILGHGLLELNEGVETTTLEAFGRRHAPRAAVMNRDDYVVALHKIAHGL